MTNLHILQSYTKATLIKAQMAASYFVFITNTQAVQEGDEGLGGDPNGVQQMPVENGMAMELKKGQDVKKMDPANVSTDMETLFRWTLRFIGGDVDLSYHSFSRRTLPRAITLQAAHGRARGARRVHCQSDESWLASRVLHGQCSASG